MEIIAALVVALLCGATGVLGLQFISNPRERRLLIRLFLAAFVLRIAFTFFSYQSGLITVLGNADDTGWKGAWGVSQRWQAVGIDSFWNIYDLSSIRKNPGWRYFSALFFHYLDIRSQIALSVFNCFVNSLTVVVIYKVAREFFTEKASLFAARVALILPGFLIWSALTIKETWLILFEITAFFAVIRFSKGHGVSRLFYLLLALSLIFIALSFRFYIAGFMAGGAIISFLCYKSRRPIFAAAAGLVIVISLAILLNATHIVRFDLVSMTQAQIEELTVFRDNISNRGLTGTSSAVQLGYDTTSPEGALKMLLVGSIYLLLSPFPWQVFGSLPQLLTLPDVLLWWYLVFVFIVPGIRYAWQRRPDLLVSTLAFTLPLIMFYGMMFGNIGLAYRQRAQLMPFLLVLVAAGYERRQRESSSSEARKTKFKVLKAQLENLETALNSPKAGRI